MEKLLDSMVIVARGASRNVRIVRIYPLTALFTFTMVIIIYCILGLITEVQKLMGVQMTLYGCSFLYLPHQGVNLTPIHPVVQN